jgi:hypothetical protein
MTQQYSYWPAYLPDPRLTDLHLPVSLVTTCHIVTPRLDSKESSQATWQGTSSGLRKNCINTLSQKKVYPHGKVFNSFSDGRSENKILFSFIDLCKSFVFKLRQGASMDLFCRLDDWLLKKIRKCPNKDDYRSLLCTCACFRLNRDKKNAKKKSSGKNCFYIAKFSHTPAWFNLFIFS